MSVISLLVLDGDKLPTLDEVRSEASRRGDPIEFVEDADLVTHTGYLPVRAYGVATGFEYYFSKITEGQLPQDLLVYGSHHIIARTGSSLEECRASLIFLDIASRLTGGAYVYPDDGLVVAPDEVSSYLAGEIASFSKLLER